MFLPHVIRFLAICFLFLLGLTSCNRVSEFKDTSLIGRDKPRKKPEFSKTLAPVRATSRPYKVKNLWYFPQPHYEYDEIGIASYYGKKDKFHGKKTASGSIFNANACTAAHPTLPLPCVVKVTNLENHKTLYVKVTDRAGDALLLGNVESLIKKIHLFINRPSKIKFQQLG